MGIGAAWVVLTRTTVLTVAPVILLRALIEIARALGLKNPYAVTSLRMGLKAQSPTSAEKNQ